MDTIWTPAKRAITALNLGKPDEIPTFELEFQLSEEFFEAFVREARITLHIKKLDGKNSHHIIEGIFKAVARALSKATALDEAHKDEMPSTKGVL